MASKIKNIKMITREQAIEFINSLLPDPENPDFTHKITLQFLIDSFAYTKNGQKYNNEAKVVLNKEDIALLGFKIEESTIETTLGRILFNFWLFSTPKLKENFGFLNKVFDKKLDGFIKDEIAIYLNEKVIDSLEIKDFINRWHWLAFNMAPLLATSMDFDTVNPNKEIIKERDQLIKEKGIHAKSNPQEYLKIQDALLKKAEETLSELDTPGIAIYNSGASKGFGNNYKNTSFARGLIPRSNNQNEMNISTKSLMEGIPKEEIHLYSDISTIASFNRAISTQDGGYKVKIINASLGHVKIDGKQDSDCGTNFYSEELIDEKNYMSHHLRYKLVGSNPRELEVLTRDVLKKNIGKVIKIRSPLFCTNPDFCQKCSGEFFYNFGSKNVGMLATKLGSSILNAALKSFHDMSIKTYRIEINPSHFRKISV